MDLIKIRLGFTIDEAYYEIIAKAINEDEVMSGVYTYANSSSEKNK